MNDFEIYEEISLFEDDLFESYVEEIFYECYSCGWVGENPFEQKSNLWGEDEIIFLCPECCEFLI